MSFGTFIKAFFVIADLAKRALIYVQILKAKKSGRYEEKLAQSEKTIEVISRNAEGQAMVDAMTEEESIADLTKP